MKCFEQGIVKVSEVFKFSNSVFFSFAFELNRHESMLWFPSLLRHLPSLIDTKASNGSFQDTSIFPYEEKFALFC